MTTIREIHALLAELILETTNRRAQAHMADAQDDLRLAVRALQPVRRPKRPRDGGVEDEPEEGQPRVDLPADNASDGRYIQGALTLNVHDAVLHGGYRSCIMGWMGTQEFHELDLSNVELRAGPPGMGPSGPYSGTAWGIRDYGVSGGKLERVDCTNFFSSKGEGHVAYLTLSLQTGQTLVYDRCRFTHVGGHGIYLTWRPGNAPEPDGKGLVIIRDCVLVNTDIDPGRGAYSISLPDTNTPHHIEQCQVVQEAPPGTYLKNGQPVGSRGLLMMEGRSGNLTVVDSLFACADSDRYAQVWLEGPPVVELVRTRFDCERVAVNHPYGDGPGTIKTKKLIVKDCTGSAELVWNGQVIGRMDNIGGGEWTL